MVGDLQQMASFLSSRTWGEPLPYSCQTLCLSPETLLPGPRLCGWGMQRGSKPAAAVLKCGGDKARWN